MILVQKVWKLIRSFAYIFRINGPGVFSEIASQTRFDSPVAISWSQAGEDICIWHELSKIASGTYIDVGAHHPTKYSVTRKLYQSGWNGINIEANADLLANFEAKRKRDINLHAVVGSFEEYEFTIFQSTEISTTNVEWKQRYEDQNFQVEKVQRLTGHTLRSIYDQYLPEIRVNLLSIDVEGSDLDVLESLSLETLENDRKPDYILLETSPPLKVTLATPAVMHALRMDYEVLFVLPMATLLRYQRQAKSHQNPL
jgi:FkbM family methyltransferase